MSGRRRYWHTVDRRQTSLVDGAPTDETSPKTSRPTAVFVMGFGRSGSSAITRMLSLCGGSLPSALVGATKDNRRGHWEPRNALYVNEAILRRHGSAGYDPTLRLQEHDPLNPDERAACVAKVRHFFEQLPAAPFVVIKELRITHLPEVWFEAATQSGYDIATVIPVRHPQECIASVAARDKLSPELTSALWLKYNLLAERHTRDRPRAFVEYANLVDDWRREMSRVSSAIGIDLGNRDDAAIEDFLSPDLRRQRDGGPVLEPFGTDWIATVYSSLCSAARDEAWEPSELDRVYAAYGASERAHRAAFTGFHDLFDSVPARLLRPSIQKLILELVALTHRRDETWSQAGRRPLV
jgi:hypothetical protein